MIVLYDENETNFKTLGIGILKDAVTCIVTEELNGKFELEMEYPISGNHFSDISLRKIIYTKPNKYDDYQPFRIYKISAPVNDLVTINAEHISYDLSGYIVEPFEEPATGIQDAFSKITNNVIGAFPFTFSTDITNAESKFNIQAPCSVRSILAGSEGSLLDTFHGEYVFDKYTVSLKKARGINRGLKIRYAKNLTDGSREIKSDKLYTDIYPYYYKIVTETDTTVSKVYQNLYIRTAKQGEDPIIPFSKNWLSLKPDNVAFVPLIKKTPIRIDTEGEYYGKIYIWDDVIENGETVSKYIEVNSEDYPPTIPNSVASTKETTEMVTLESKTIPITGRENILPKRILPLNLADSFESKPTEEELRTKANEYISNNNIGEVIETVEASFIKIDDDSINEIECHVGDYVTIIYKDINLNSTLQVVSAEYDVLTNMYNDIGLGKKESHMSDNVASIGDNVSVFNNDANYTDEIKVGELIAKTITAEYIEAQNADFTEAQIKALQTDSLITSGIIQAAEAAIDILVADLLVADNAAVRKQLMIGENLIVNGEININNGSIAITDDKIIINGVRIEPTPAYINQNGTEYTSNWLKDSYTATTALTPDPNKVYKVFDEHNVWIQEYYRYDTTENRYKYFFPDTATYFEVDKNGNIYANSATIAGHIEAKSGMIGDCKIEGEPETYTNAYIISGKEDFASDWLTLTEGSTNPLIPDTTTIYKVMYNYDYHYFKYNGYQYKDMLVGVLQVYSANIQDLTTSVINAVNGLNISIFTNNKNYQTGTEVSSAITTATDGLRSEDYVDGAIEDYWEPYMDSNAKIKGAEINAKGISVTAVISGQEETVFGIDANGNVTVRGTIYANAGNIGGCSFVNGVLKVGAINFTNLDQSGNAVYATNSELTTTNNNVSTLNTNLGTTNTNLSNLTGRVSDTEDAITDLSVATEGLVDYAELTGVSINSDGFRVKNSNNEDAFYLDPNGNLTIKGVITATSGKIGDFLLYKKYYDDPWGGGYEDYWTRIQEGNRDNHNDTTNEGVILDFEGLSIVRKIQNVPSYSGYSTIRNGTILSTNILIDYGYRINNYVVDTDRITGPLLMLRSTSSTTGAEVDTRTNFEGITEQNYFMYITEMNVGAGKDKGVYFGIDSNFFIEYATVTQIDDSNTSENPIVTIINRGDRAVKIHNYSANSHTYKILVIFNRNKT